MQEIQLVVMFVEPGMSLLDVTAELLNATAGGWGPKICFENIVAGGKASYHGSIVEYVVFCEDKEVFDNRGKYKRMTKIISENIDATSDIYSDIHLDDMHVAIQWLRTTEAEENGIELGIKNMGW